MLAGCWRGDRQQGREKFVIPSTRLKFTVVVAFLASIKNLLKGGKKEHQGGKNVTGFFLSMFSLGKYNTVVLPM